MMDSRDQVIAPETRARELLSQLTLDEKMAQLGCIFPINGGEHDYENISRQTRWGIGQVSTLEMRRMETLEEVAAWQRKVQRIIMENSPHHIPAIFHMEGICGPFIQDSASFPSGIARGASFDIELERQIGKIVSRQEAACGMTQVFAPVLDIARDPRMGRYAEPYSEDPSLAAAMGVAYTKGVQETQTDGRRPESVGKHFLAFHNSQGGIHGSHSDTPPRLLREVYAKPFQAAITEAGLKCIMPCYNVFDGEPVSCSKAVLNDLLRDEMGFEGTCISDYGAINNAHSVQHVGETLEEAAQLCIEAGMDVELPSVAGFGEALRRRFESGEADMAVLDRAVLRVLTAKLRMGLFEHPFAMEGEALHKTVCEGGERAVSLQSARESLVLLKNDGILPLKNQIRKIAVIGPHANCARKFFGGYTHLCMMESTYAVANSIAGVSGILQPEDLEVRTIPGTNIQSDEGELFDAILRRQKPDCRSLLEELRARLSNVEITYAYGYPVAGKDQSGFDEAIAAAKDADLVLLTLGGKHGTCSMSSMGEGVDATDINLPPCQDAFIATAAKLGLPMVGIHLDGRPISSDTADQALNAILEAWSPAECGAEAIVDVLLGEYNPGGKLPVTVARSAGQLPIYYNHPYGSAWHQEGSIGFVNYVDMPHTPRYCFGHGLSYTRFNYSDLRLSQKEISPEDVVQISVMLENTGELAGTEIVQLYLRDEYASMTRPVKFLAGFCRVDLEPGQKKRVSFELHADQTAFLDRDMRWKVEKGEIAVEVGTSSEDIRLNGAFSIAKDAWIDGAKKTNYAIGNAMPELSGTD